MQQSTYPTVTLTVGGQHRWQGNKVRVSLANNYLYFFTVPDEFTAGTEESIELMVGQSYKYNV